MIYTHDKSLRSERRKFEQYLTAIGLRLTNGRRTVFEEVMIAHGHFAIEELIKQCRRHEQKVSRATIYRYIRELLEAGVIRETAFGEKHQHYEHIYDETKHHHARCVRCNDQIEFPDLEEDMMYTKIMKDLGFHVLGHEMHFYGICQKCQNLQKTKL